MTAERPGTLGLALLTGMLALADGTLAALGLLIWHALWRGDLAGTEAATLLLLGASAAVGALVYVLALLALARGHQGARSTSALALLRVAGVLVALVLITVRFGVDAIAGPIETFGAVVAVAEVLGALTVTRVISRRTVPGGHI
jgi:hypothetical protein